MFRQSFACCIARLPKGVPRRLGRRRMCVLIGLVVLIFLLLRILKKVNKRDLGQPFVHKAYQQDGIGIKNLKTF